MRRGSRRRRGRWLEIRDQPAELHPIPNYLQAAGHLRAVIHYANQADPETLTLLLQLPSLRTEPFQKDYEQQADFYH